MKRELTFTVACLYETALLVLALAWAWLFDQAAWKRVHGSLQHGLLGMVAALPPLLFFAWTLRSTVPAFARHRQTMESLLRPLFGNWSILQLAVISAVAGIAEEALFRGAIQASLSGRIGSIAALVLSSVLFGVSHFITRTYAVLAGTVGLYLGLLWLWTGDLLTPVVTHALYDFLALVYFLRLYRPRAGARQPGR